jgi:hypothetical protein
LRLRPDKTTAEIDTLETVKRLVESAESPQDGRILEKSGSRTGDGGED